MPEPSVVVRVSPEVLAQIEAAALRAGIKRSLWCRQVLESAATGRPRPAAKKLDGSCEHPRTQRQVLPYLTRCGQCGLKL